MNRAKYFIPIISTLLFASANASAESNLLSTDSPLSDIHPSKPIPSDSLPSGWNMKKQWRVGAKITPSAVLPTNVFYKGANIKGKKIHAGLAEDITSSFTFDPLSQEGALYPELYTGAGLSIRTYFDRTLLGTPGSFYLLQGAPFAHFGNHWSLGYEWNFGISYGWKHTSYDPIETASAISTPVLAHMGVALKLNYEIDPRWRLTLGLEATHFSNGNTSWKNGGMNTAGLSFGASYLLNPYSGRREESSDIIFSDKGKWLFDIMGYGAWHQAVRTVTLPIDYPVDFDTTAEVLVPRKFGVAGITFSALRRLNQWIAVGPGAELKWDGSSGLSYYWEDGEDPTFENLKFREARFGKQISAAVTGQAELTTPIFAVNAAIGLNVLNPHGDKFFFQQLTFKAFVTEKVFLNIGYRLGNFSDPLNLMLGLGVRL